MPDLLTVREVATIYKVHQITIRRHINQGKLKAVRVGNSVRLRQEDVEAYLRPEEPYPKPKRKRPSASDQKTAKRSRIFTKDDALFRLVGITEVHDAASLSSDKYAAFPEAFSPRE